MSIDPITGRLTDYKARKILGRRRMTRAAVAIVLNEQPLRANTTNKNEHTSELCILMIKRAQHPKDPWSGHMAFPGGRMEKVDGKSIVTAQRETEEEIGLQLNRNECIGRLSDVITRRHDKLRPMVVSPWVYRLNTDPNTRIQNVEANYEVDEIVWIPLAFFADENNREVMEWKKMGANIKLPCYFYERRRVWGLSLMMINELVQLAA